MDLHTIKVVPTNVWTQVTISNPTAFRYVRYLSPAQSNGNVAEVEFYS